MSQQQADNELKYDIQADLQRYPYLLTRLAENSLIVAESLRDNYFQNTSTFITNLRQAMQAAREGKRPDSILTVHPVEDANWASVQGEVVTFIDGGVGQVNFSSRVPLLLRVGSYSVRTGERQLAKREQFGYYPVILGDLEGGSRDRKDFADIVRITAELIGGLSVLERTRDLRVLMFHGPLVYPMSAYAGHTPFTEGDIDLFLRHYALDSQMGRRLKETFLREAEMDIYPRMTERSDEWVERRLFEPLAWIAFLYRYLISVALQRKPVPIIAGVVERSESNEFGEKILLDRIFRSLRSSENPHRNPHYFNDLFGRRDLTSPKAVMDRLGYTDALLLGPLLESGQFSEPWQIRKNDSLRSRNLALPGESGTSQVDFAALRSGRHGFPSVRACYVKVSETTEPVRVEVFDDLGSEQIPAAAKRAYLYSRLLPGYGFPVGLDVADKFAHIPKWLTDAYGKLIQYHLGVSLQRGEITDAEMRRVLVQSIYMTKRDWLFRPKL